MNRGLARRPVFETREDVRFLLSRLALAARRRQIEVHAYSVLATHFHLLVRSLNGDLSRSLMWVENQYARWFNRRRRRDGPLFRGRFRSRAITTATYWRNVLLYIDHNPVSARIVDHPCEYPHGSAWHYARERGPVWLARSHVESEVAAWFGDARFEPRTYRLLHRGRRLDEVGWLIERRLGIRAQGEDPLDDLVAAAPGVVRAWMQRKARLGDGTPVRDVLLSPSVLLEEIRCRIELEPDWRVRPDAKAKPGWAVVASGLLGAACGLGTQEIAARLGSNASTVWRYGRDHARLVLESEAYAERAEKVLQGALARLHHLTHTVPGTDAPAI